MFFFPSPEKTASSIRKKFCPRCRRLSKRKKECPFFEICVVSVYSLKKKIPLHFKPA